MSLTETRFSSVRARFPLRSRRTCEYIQPRCSLLRACYTYSRMLHLLVSLFVFFSFFFLTLVPICSMTCMDARRMEKGEKGRARWGKVSRRAATISSLHGNAPSTPFSFDWHALDKRTRSVVMFFFLDRPSFSNDQRWKRGINSNCGEMIFLLFFF